MAELEKVIKGLECCRRGFCFSCPYNDGVDENTECKQKWADDALSLLKAQDADESKYEYHTDHADCIWYTPDEESKCPVTCSQYRDGWNDAMNYIFRNGDGYRPYDRTRKGR